MTVKNIFTVCILSVLFVVSYTLLNETPRKNILEIKTVEDVQKILENQPKGTVVLIDVDDTLITPVSNIFRASSPYRTLMDEIKKNRETIKNFEAIISHWRLQRKIMLVSELWPSFINALKKKYLVYALTKMDTGPIGDIPSMEEWRYQELQSVSIEFTPYWETALEKKINSKEGSGAFYRGIFITGQLKKGDIVRKIVQTKTVPKIIFIDDRQEQISEVSTECENLGIPFLGILFKGVDLLGGQPIPEVAEYQKMHLLSHAEWLEDDEAKHRLKSQNIH